MDQFKTPPQIFMKLANYNSFSLRSPYKQTFNFGQRGWSGQIASF